MSRAPSWRAVAYVLAGRVANFAALAGNGGPNGGCDHSVAEADPENCAPCDDRAALQLYRDKLTSEGGRS